VQTTDGLIVADNARVTALDAANSITTTLHFVSVNGVRPMQSLQLIVIHCVESSKPLSIASPEKGASCSLQKLLLILSCKAEVRNDASYPGSRLLVVHFPGCSKCLVVQYPVLWKLVNFITWQEKQFEEAHVYGDEADALKTLDEVLRGRPPPMCAQVSRIHVTRARRAAFFKREEAAKPVAPLTSPSSCDKVVSTVLVGSRCDSTTLNQLGECGKRGKRSNSSSKQLSRGSMKLLGAWWTDRACIVRKRKHFHISEHAKHPLNDSSKLYMHYLYKLNDSSKWSAFVEARTRMECTWCHAQRETLAELLQHLRACHYHFAYEAATDQHKNAHIIVRRDRDASVLDSTQILREHLEQYLFFSGRKYPRLHTTTMHEHEKVNISYISAYKHNLTAPGGRNSERAR
jgi:hypothetical protein